MYYTRCSTLSPNLWCGFNHFRPPLKRQAHWVGEREIEEKFWSRFKTSSSLLIAFLCPLFWPGHLQQIIRSIVAYRMNVLAKMHLESHSRSSMAQINRWNPTSSTYSHFRNRSGVFRKTTCAFFRVRSSSLWNGWRGHLRARELSWKLVKLHSHPIKVWCLSSEPSEKRARR